MYHRGLRAVLALFIALAGIVVLQLMVLKHLNRCHEKKRRILGKSELLRDVSMEERYEPFHSENAGMNAFDKTDRKNEEFIYIY